MLATKRKMLSIHQLELKCRPFHYSADFADLVYVHFADCPYCRYHSVSPSPESHKNHTTTSTNDKQALSGLYEDEVLQLVWTLCPPDCVD